MNDRICRWGILGTAQIARKNWKAIWNAPNCLLTAVASRSKERCRQFIHECQWQAPMDLSSQTPRSYEGLLADDDVDAVYIPLPTRVRKEWVIRAAEAGKHVLVEKPVGATAEDVAEMLEACRQNNVQFMDGVMFMHSRRLDLIRGVLKDGASVGRVRRITTQFTFCAPDEFFEANIRSTSELEPLGCLGDLGWYNIRFILWVMNWQLPQAVCGRMLSEHRRQDSPAPIPTEFSAELFYADGVSASFYCSFLTENQEWVNVSGTKGYLYVPDFVLPYYGNELAFEVSNAVFRVTGCDFNMEDHTRRFAVPEYSNSAENAQEAMMFRRFSELALSGSPDPYWGEIALKTQQVLDACLESARSDGRAVSLNHLT
jgi:predicted dehydrogenase